MPLTRSSPVRANTMNSEASLPVVIQSFGPLRTKWSPSSRASHASAAASDPEPASDRQ